MIFQNLDAAFGVLAVLILSMGSIRWIKYELSNTVDVSTWMTTFLFSLGIFCIFLAILFYTP
ncbi:hypothetical protein [Caulobacter phage Cr30]|uniref:hypothetical protein n=1 Tax=Caulobacter phage Cr30 TaxID=1357714 RepID=UPI0004A9B591|nr:hypothetical protein OZ74_gp197 [Caulobacter phage Cr30]AGS81146.1 hypothetical protein [Caulobacter phage Cr30]